jgi:wyosine [tRNA(Phe)-imidazoG37] synthetase (radical SAM superfamily)
MELVNPLTAFQWSEPLDINGVAMMGIPEKQGISFSRAGYLAARKDPRMDADDWGRSIRQRLRPLSRPVLAEARKEYQEKRVPPFPRYFIIEPVNICNRACPFCMITVMRRNPSHGHRGKGFMPWKTFLRLMEETAKFPVYGISLYQLGEPFLWVGKDEAGRRMNIADIVNGAKRIGGFRVANLSTNGDVKNLDCVLGSELDDLIFSIDGMTKEVYEANRPGMTRHDTFERTLGWVVAFLKKKAGRGEGKPFVRMQIINKENTRPQIEEFIRYWIEVPGVDDVYVKHLDSMRSWLGARVVSEEEDRIKAERVGQISCQHLFSIGSMVVNGDFTACCHDAFTELVEKVPGSASLTNSNIHNTSFASWWRGTFMNQLRGEHLAGHFRQPCDKCRERDPWLG